MSRKKIILIDGLSLAFRAFFALPPTLTNKAGQSTNAVYGFTTMLLKVLEDEKPAVAVVAFDRPEPTFRDKIFEEYKAQRPPVAAEFIAQEPLIKKMISALKIPLVEKAGFEADDIIGTLARKAAAENYEVLIVTGDLDSLQLVDAHIKVLTTRKGLTDTFIYDEAAVRTRFGFDPRQMVDYKALRGDPSDNIPGVKGIGEKTATGLILAYGSLEKILENSTDIKPESLRTKIETGRDLALLSQKLARIDTAVPVNFDFEKHPLEFEPGNQEALALYSELDFKSLIKKYRSKTLFEDTPDYSRPEITTGEFKIIKTEKELEEFVADLNRQEIFAFDLETTALNPFEAAIAGAAVTFGGRDFYVPFTEKNSAGRLHQLQPALENQHIKKIAHNAKFELQILKAHGLKPTGFFFDTMVAAYLLNPEKNRYGLKDLSREILGRSARTYEDLLGKEKDRTIFEVDENELAAYATSDSRNTYALYEIFDRELDKKNLRELFDDMEMPLVEILADMELAGIKVDPKKLKLISVDLAEKMKCLEKDIFCLAGETFNINSPQQLGKILFDKLKMPVMHRTKTGASTGADVLEKLAPEFEIAARILEYRTYSKIKSTYTDALPELIEPKTHRVHTSFNQTVAATGRLSSSQPNLQNIPVRTELGQKIRAAFVAEKGHQLMAFDYSQIELRILAHFSKDKNLINAFLEDHDIHSATASQIFKVPLEEVTGDMRRAAKTINFGIIYGMGAQSLAQSLKISRTAAQEYIDKYFENYHYVREYLSSIPETTREQGYITTLFHRRRYFPDISAPPGRFRAFAERAAVNAPLQGTAADIIKIAMVKIAEYLKKQAGGTRMILQVHDELVFEVPDQEIPAMEKAITRLMEEAVELKVPLKVSCGIGANWAEAG